MRRFNGATRNVFLLLAQVAAWNSAEKRLAFARPLLLGKLAGQRQLLQRHALDHGSSACAEAVSRLGLFERRVSEEADVDALMGLEGAAAAAYFQAFGDMLSGEWTWPGRVRRPPRDPVNALLSFGYVLAGGEVARHLMLAGFDLRVGILHGIRYGRESLALDLVEELRAPMVDRFTLRLLNKGQLGQADFEPHEEGAVRLTPEGRRKYLELWETMLDRKAPRLRNEETTAEEQGGRGRRVRRPGAPVEDGAEQVLSWRFRIERQVQRLRKFLMEGAAYRPLHRTRKQADPARGGDGRDSQPVDGTEGPGKDDDETGAAG